MVEPITINVKHLSQDVRIPQEQVQAAIDLLDAGFPIPFIARYRKEATRNLKEEALRQIDEELRFTRVLCERKLTILKTLAAAGKLTPEFDKDIREAKSLKRLEDLYLPFKPKKQNPATKARDSGLEPLALEIIEGKVSAEKLDERAAEFINEDKKVNSVADVLLGAGHIIADIFGTKAELVYRVRDIFYQHGQLITKKVETAADKTAADKTADGKQETADGKRETADDRRQTAEEELAGSPREPKPAVESNEPKTEATAEEELADSTCEPEPEAEAAVLNMEGERSEMTEAVETTDDRRQAAEENTEEIIGDEIVTDETIDDSIPETEASETETPEDEVAEGDSQEITELFEQAIEKRAEEGAPKVISQNTLKKKKKAEAKKKQDEIKQRQREHFARQFVEYFDFSIKLRGIPAHRILAFNRGEKHRMIQITLQIDEARVLEAVREVCVPKDHVHADFLTGCLKDALQRGVLPMLRLEIRNEMTEYAEKNVVKNFGQNLRHQLMLPPLPGKRVLALEPSGKQGCIVVALDEFGNLVGRETVLFGGSTQRRELAAKTLAEMINRFGLSVIAIGNGGGGRVAEEAIAQMIETHFKDSDLAYTMVNKCGSMAYSTSPVGREELPNEDTFVRAAVSIGRRLQNSLNELVKIEPINLGQGMLQHDIRGKHVKQTLDEILQSCVSAVGVDLNSATPALLAHVAGLNLMTARRIYESRREHGAFRTREDLKKVPGINESVYTYAAGFLRIAGGENPLDATHIHPESYELAASIIEKLGFAVNDLRSGEKMKGVAAKIASEKIGELTAKLSSELNASPHAVRDILEELSKPGRDPRESQPPLVFRKTPLKLEDLTPGMELTGTILNVTDFGAFVDVGLPESGFIHISQMSTGYIQNAHEKVATGNVVRLWVVEPDSAKKRIALSMLPPGVEKQPPNFRKPADGERERPPREQPREHSPRPPRPEGTRPAGARPAGERREFSDKPMGDKSMGDRPPRDSHRDSRDGKRFDRKPFDRSPKTFVSAPVKKEVKPITEKMKQGKEPMRSFSDLAQLFGQAPANEEEGKKGKK